MKNQKNRILAIIVAILLTSSAFAILPLSNAKNTNVVIPTYAYLSAEPTPLAAGQTLYIDMWIDKVPATAGGYWGDRFVNFTIQVTLPDKTTATLGPFISDAAGGAATTFVPTAQGNYTFVFTFPGETLTGAQGNPLHPYPNAYIDNPAAIGDVYGASTSTPLTVTVGTTAATQTPENPLPTGYWQTPVEAFNHNWSVLNGNWFGDATINFGSSGIYGYQGSVNPYTQPVLTPHLLWTKPEGFGGQMGGPFIGNESTNYYTGMQYQPKFDPIVLNGILYYTNYPVALTNPSGWIALNLRTGQVLWTKNTTEVIQFGMVTDPATLDEYGGVPYLFATRTQTFSGAGTFLDMYDAATGNYVETIANITAGTKLVDTNGGVIEYYTNSSTVNGVSLHSLTMWNLTQCLISGMAGFRTGQTVVAGLWQPVQNAIIQYKTGIVWSIQTPNTYQGIPINLGIGYIDQADQKIVMTYTTSPTVGSVGSQTGWQMEAGYSMGGAMDVAGPATQLWITNRTETPYCSIFMGPAADGIFCEFTEETMSWQGFNINTGAHVWGPTQAYTKSLGYYVYRTSADVLGTNLITWTFGGQIYDYNITNGNVIWIWSNPSSGEDNPYGINPFWAFGTGEVTIAGGVIYAATGHNYGPPLFSGADVYAINATNGKLIWQFLNFATMSSLPVVDGELLTFNSYDNQIYAYGKGLTATTATTAPVINSNAQVWITGTVTDQSPGQTCLGIPAAGTPAIADAYMSDWMAYLYEQSPKPLNATGVPVTLTYVDPNNNTGTIGTTYSDITGHYQYAFNPPVPGAYTITATFGGSNSYYSSTAETSFKFVTPASATPAPTATPTSVVETYFVPAVIGIIVAIIIVGAILAVLSLRKRP